MRDNAVLDGDTLHGSSVINGWGLGFGSSFLIKLRGWKPYYYVMICYVLDYMVCLDIYLSLAV